MPSIDKVSDFLYSNLDKVIEKKFKNGIEFNARCPICGDSKKSLHKKRFHLKFIDSENIVWHCFNCESTGNFYHLYAYIEGITPEEAYKVLNKYSKNRAKDSIKRKSTKKIKEKKSDNQNFNFILKDCISLDEKTEGSIHKQLQDRLKSFIEKRKISFPIYIAYKGKYKNRYIIPIIEDGNIIYFQGRRIFDTMEPKYKNPSVEKTNIILNRKNFDKEKYIIITEGLLDADAIGMQGTSMLGKSLSKEFRDKILEYTNKGIILSLDNDEDGMDKILEYSKKYKSILYFLMPIEFKNQKDLNDLLVHNYINRNSMYQFVVDNSYTGASAYIICKKRRLI